jgi:hypothetical protein
MAFVHAALALDVSSLQGRTRDVQDLSRYLHDSLSNDWSVKEFYALARYSSVKLVHSSHYLCRGLDMETVW